MITYFERYGENRIFFCVFSNMKKRLLFADKFIKYLLTLLKTNDNIVNCISSSFLCDFLRKAAFNALQNEKMYIITSYPLTI